ncbi:MAG: hypothetical protein ABFD54_02845 [Armatimonadota bacterium]|nr:glycoside hydrolase family 127 protein [bacterium]
MIDCSMGNMLALLGVLAIASLTPAMSADEKAVPGIPGNVLNLKTITSRPNGDRMTVHKPAGDIDLKGMARWAMNYLLRSPRPDVDYQPIFSCWPLGCPPVPTGWDQIVDGDTDCRMDWEMYYMRDICGATEGRDTEAKFHQRIRNYLGDHDLCWTYIGCYDMDPSPEKTKAKGMVGNVWATTKLLKSLSLSYERTHNPEDKALARRVFVALRSLASWSGKYAWFEGGMGPLNKELKPANSGWGIHPPPIVESLVCYWQACDDPEAITFAKAFADGIISRARPGNVVQINDDGTFTGHTHATLHAMHGIAHLGIATNNREYIEFCRRIYSFVMTHGTGTGWIHEAITPTIDSKVPSGETCATSDMMSIVSYLAQADRIWPGQGYSDYYDHLERYLRNYIAPAQFFMTPHFIEFYRARHKDKPTEAIEKGLADLHKMEGGIIGGIGINDLTNDWLGDSRTSFAMQGCCAPEGMRAIHTVWESIVSHDPTGKAVYVNMSLSTETPEVKVVSYLPDEGRLTAITRKSGDFYLRPPAWSPREGVKAWRNGVEIPVKWHYSYVAFDDVRSGDEVTITYPFISYEQKVAIWPDTSKVAVYKWIGNTAIDVEPKGTSFPLYTGKRPWLPPPPQLPD